MSGPYCETCKHFYLPPLSNGNGECQDPSKVIKAYGGQSLNDPPEVSGMCSCDNWKKTD